LQKDIDILLLAYSKRREGCDSLLRIRCLVVAYLKK